MRLYKNCNLECASSTAERTKEHTHTTHGGGKKLVDLCAYVCNIFVLYIAHLVGHFFLLLVGHFYVSFQFYSVFVFEALSVDERCSFYCDMRCSAIIRLFPMLIKWLVRIYISSLSLSSSHFIIAISSPFSSRGKKINLPELLTAVNMHGKVKSVSNGWSFRVCTTVEWK